MTLFVLLLLLGYGLLACRPEPLVSRGSKHP
jgi:hypothetical protein